MSTQPLSLSDESPSARISLRLKLYFAALTCLGGLVLSAGTDNTSVPAIAIFFGVFGFVFVDWLELFALPPIAAYAAMGVAALFCVSDFLELDAPGNHQMVVVAQLLVLVQAILMLQRKTRRIFEQLAVFCLLELIVAAVFNDALLFGLLLIPIALIGAMALSLLSVTWTTDGGHDADEQARRKVTALKKAGQVAPVISVNAGESWESLNGVALKVPRVALMTLAPAVFLVAAIFFYALPRTTDAARVQGRGNAVVGFSNELRLEQIGQMMQSTQPVLRLYLTDRSSSEPYQPVGGIYLRGKVLERYREFNPGASSPASWIALPAGFISEPQRLPLEYLPERSTDQSFYDNVDVKVVCESMRSNALFAVAPYYQMAPMSEVIHFAELWTLARGQEDDWVYPRVEYRFGTHAFRSGIQSELTTFRDLGQPFYSGLSMRGINVAQQAGDDERRQRDYLEEMLVFDEDAMPTIAETAEALTVDANGQRRKDYAIAKAMERHFVSMGQYEYTLNLDAEPVPGLDPIEQFVRIDKRGHCQYFASALAMMLRSQGIPARLVVGYHTDEYNELGRHYVARQLHAHAWVEALIDREQLESRQLVYGQRPANKYWLRLDPTPAAGRVREASRVGQVFDLAQTMWDDYVVEMDAERQESALMGGGSNPMNRSYKQFVDRLGLLLSRIRAGELGGGSLASGDLFSWQAAVLAAVALLALALLLRIRPPRWIRRRRERGLSTEVARPTIDFYAETLRQLERVGLRRQVGQTPQELLGLAEQFFCSRGEDAIAPSLQRLTFGFYQQRFGSPPSQEHLEKGHSIAHASAGSVGPNQPQLDHALVELTRGVDSILKRAINSERAT